MSMMRWRPFNELQTWHRAMDRLFDEAMTRPGRWWETDEPMATFAIDVYQTDNEVVLKAALPGVKPEDVEVTVHGETVTIKGEMKAESEVKKENYLYQESRFGSFYREVNLPVPVSMDKADAKFENGMLIVTLPKAEQAKAKQIKVKVHPAIAGPTNKPDEHKK
jgi:HSP20 family protein